MGGIFKQREAGFRLGTGAVACFLVLIVIAIGFELVRQSQLALTKFGFGFWVNDIWDPVCRLVDAFGLDRCMWGTDWTRAAPVVAYKPAVDALYTRVPRETRYKGKNFVETAVWRFGDVLVTSGVSVLTWLGVGVGGMGLIGAGVAATSAWVARRAGRAPDLAKD